MKTLVDMRREAWTREITCRESGDITLANFYRKARWRATMALLASSGWTDYGQVSE